MNRRIPALLLLAALSALPACRSDGGFGRRDSNQSRRDLAHFLSQRFEDHSARTRRNFERFDDAIVGEFERGTARMKSSWALYLGDYAEYHSLRVTEPSSSPILGDE